MKYSCGHDSHGERVPDSDKMPHELMPVSTALCPACVQHNQPIHRQPDQGAQPSADQRARVFGEAMAVSLRESVKEQRAAQPSDQEKVLKVWLEAVERNGAIYTPFGDKLLFLGISWADAASKLPTSGGPQKTIEAWCCGIAADHELGNTEVTIYASEQDCLEANECSREEPNSCAPRKLTVTYQTSLLEAAWPNQRKEELPQINFFHGEDGFIIAECPTLPGCASQGKDALSVLENIADAISSVVSVRKHAECPASAEGKVGAEEADRLQAQETIAKEYGTDWDGLVESLSSPMRATDVLMDLASTEAALILSNRQLLAAREEIARPNKEYVTPRKNRAVDQPSQGYGSVAEALEGK